MKAYQWLLRLYPLSFRAEYGAEMSEAFAARRMRENGLTLWVKTIFEVLAGALRVHADILWQDLGWSVRTLRRSPAFAITAVLVAAVGIGGNTAAFTLLDHVLLEPLPFSHPEQLVAVYQTQVSNGYSRISTSPANFRDWQTMSKSFESMGAYREVSVNLSGQGTPEQLGGVAISAEIFKVFKVQPAIGRAFTTEDTREGAPDVVLLSEDLATTLFNNAANAMGRSLHLDNQPYTIIGVMPSGFSFPTRAAQFWVPLQFSPAMFTDPENRANLSVNVVARLQQGISVEKAQGDLARVAQQLERLYPRQNAGVGTNVVAMRDVISPQSRMLVIAVFGAACCVLLIACTNLANLLFARSMVRRREMAVRLAIGAGRERLLRQLFTENFVLAMIGGAVGLLFAMFTTPLLARLVPDTLPINGEAHMSSRIFLFVVALTVVTCIAFGAGPALKASRQIDATALRMRSNASGRSERFRSTLVLVEITCTVVLMISAGLLLKALWRVEVVHPGFRADHVLTLRTSLPLPKYSENLLRTQFYSSVLTKTRALPGVNSAAYISFLPMVFGGGIFPVTPSGVTSNAPPAQASIRYITPDFFKSLRIPLLSGRDISDRDTATAPFVAVISESMGKRLWPGQDPIGHQLNVAFFDRTVVGVVSDIAVRGLERASEPQIYLSAEQVPNAAMTFFAPKDLVVRTSGDPRALIPALRRIVREADPEQAVSHVQTLEDVIYSQTTSRRTQLRALCVFATLAFLLATIGIYGLLSFTVSTRLQEVGVRLALGARQSNILGMFLYKGFVLGGIGTVIALPLSYIAARSMSALLFKVQPSDPLVYVGAAVLAMVLTLIGSFGPALRAANVDPAITIRSEL